MGKADTSHESPPCASETVREGLAEICTLGAVPSWEHWSELEAALPRFLKQRRWFGGKTRSIQHVRIADAVALSQGGSPTLFLVEVTYDDGPGDSYHIPLVFLEGPEAESILAFDPGAVVAKIRDVGADRHGVVVDGFRSREFCRTLLGLIEEGCEIRSGSGQLNARLASWIPREGVFQATALEPRVLASEQSNTSVIFGERFILKMFRRVTAGRNPDLEIGLFLTDNGGFANSPRVAGWLEYGPEQEESRILAVLHEYIPATRDAWEFTREELKCFFNRVLDLPSEAAAPEFGGRLTDLLTREASGLVATALGSFPALAGLLGCRTAQLHLALSAHPDNQDFAPEPYGDECQRDDYQSMKNLAQETLRQLRLCLDSLPVDLRSQASELLSKENQIFARLEEFRQQRLQAFRIRNHGDYHLGQVLYTGKDFVIIDFEGEPARKPSDRLRKGSALRDVAGMIRSFHYAAQSTLLEQTDKQGDSATDLKRLEIWTELWYYEVSRAFLRGYWEAASGASFLPMNQDELSILLQAFLLEKTLYEIGYELNNRPSWLRIPLRGICNLEM